MSLILNNIIIISIALSNGGTVSFELNNEIQTRRIIISNQEDNLDILEIYKNNCFYEFDLVSNSFLQKEEKPKDTLGSFLVDFDLELIPFDADRKCILLKKNIIQNMYSVHYFVEIDELASFRLTNPHLSILEENQVHVFTDVFVNDYRESAYPISATVSFRDEFSDFITKRLNDID